MRLIEVAGETKEGSSSIRPQSKSAAARQHYSATTKKLWQLRFVGLILDCVRGLSLSDLDIMFVLAMCSIAATIKPRT